MLQADCKSSASGRAHSVDMHTNTNRCERIINLIDACLAEIEGSMGHVSSPTRPVHIARGPDR